MGFWLLESEAKEFGVPIRFAFRDPLLSSPSLSFFESAIERHLRGAAWVAFLDCEMEVGSGLLSTRV